MKTIIKTLLGTAIALACSCMVSVNDPETPSGGNGGGGGHPTPTPVPFTYKTIGFFPFEDNSNRWHYTESGGNDVTIRVTDTISDDGIMYYRVLFEENRVDTTDDWFKRSASGVLFGESLTGSYSLFLPAKIDSVRGGFICAGLSADYTYYDALSMNGITFRHALTLRYSAPLLHGFDVITFADSVGILQLQDHHGRWPIVYTIDSCTLSGVTRKF
jgi:hypothetical protein